MYLIYILASRHRHVLKERAGVRTILCTDICQSVQTGGPNPGANPKIFIMTN